ncbi:uncharacterized protein BDR25DRAFT_339494 [Lindgomyces ingoldianus]|uniref:Uncharacterized protein n=1 Tax=Lindgomyces ingoldianus TaxID=673940 RepID=A0ACB6RB41_9PLEO|nr:uncharacterized protein BDR25DRAFT_339494 [Lindgomyces ingoldianus]KAF2476503.1 hypothetical protein BDR25DRAFT_339494 [Lindgomyces ingoldianus]
MWILEHESLFGGRRVWLRPGTQLLYGRTNPGKTGAGEGKACFIDSKRVSRKHMMLKVSEVSPRDGTNLHSRTQVEITDLSGNSGTFVDGTKLTNKEGEQRSMFLSGTEHVIKLGFTYPPFTIKWFQVVITYASKEAKETKALLHALDIKTSSDFVYGRTTHVVSTKRNLPKVLQALVTGTPIVTSKFLDAIIQVAAPQNEDPEKYLPSKLEEDFDRCWPNEKKFIPPVSAEPIERSDEMLEPDLGRAEVFHGLSFVFLDEGQYNSLHEPIAGGGGKALLFHVRPGETTVDEYVEFVKNTAGQKRRAKSNDRLPVVTVRLSNWPEGMDEWAMNFVTGVDQALNQRSILQNEFLDAIITKDTSSLQKPPSKLEVASSMPATTAPESSMRDRTPVARTRAPSQVLETTPVPEELPKTIPRKRPIRRAITQSRFTGFDDYEPPIKSRKMNNAPKEGIQELNPVQDSFQDTQSRSIPIGRKCPSPVRETIEENDQLHTLFPTAAAIRKRRLATRGPSVPLEPEATLTDPRRPKMLDNVHKLKNVTKVIDVREQARQRIQEEEERQRADEESLREMLDGVDISEIRNLVQIEEMDVLPRSRGGRRSHQQLQQNKVRSDRWNEEWNGRKNFKKFRQRGAARGPEMQKVIVPFEEVPQKKGGVLGDAFFLEEEQKTRSKEDERRLARRIGRPRDDSSEPEPGFTRRKRKQQQQQQQQQQPQQSDVIHISDSGLDDEEALEETPGSGRTQRVQETQIEETQTQTRKGARKRGPAVVAAGPSKRSKVTKRDEDSDEEETGFRFRRRR